MTLCLEELSRTQHRREESKKKMAVFFFKRTQIQQVKEKRLGSLEFAAQKTGEEEATE
jgi:hypothetical protein